MGLGLHGCCDLAIPYVKLHTSPFSQNMDSSLYSCIQSRTEYNTRFGHLMSILSHSQFPSRGHSHWKVVRGCAAVMTSFFQDSWLSLAYQFTINGPLIYLSHFQFLEKLFIFSLVLAKISALKMQIFWIFTPKTPHFSRKICSVDPTFGNLCGTHPPIKSWVPPHFTLRENTHASIRDASEPCRDMLWHRVHFWSDKL